MGISSGQHVALTKEQFSIWESPLLQTIVQSWQKNKKQTGEWNLVCSQKDLSDEIL